MYGVSVWCVLCVICVYCECVVFWCVLFLCSCVRLRVCVVRLACSNWGVSRLFLFGFCVFWECVLRVCMCVVVFVFMLCLCVWLRLSLSV